MRPTTKPPVPDTRREKAVESLGDKIMVAAGFQVVRFSQARASRQTRGISDRLYINEDRALGVFWEAKTTTGKQSIHQKWFQRLMTSVGWPYLVGTEEVLLAWLRDNGVIR